MNIATKVKKGKAMGIVVNSEDSRLKLLSLLTKMDKGYIPSEDECTYLTDLQYLDLSETEISALPESIGSLTNLQHLNLTGTKISILPESIGSLTNLQQLDLFWTKISTLPESIGSLTNLQQLNLSGTKISTLPESIGSLTNLQQLNLSGTKISTLPESISSLTNLQQLNLSKTEISILPESIGSLTNLQELDLSGTDIRVLPDALGNLTNLEILDLSGMLLDQIPESVFNLDLEFSFEPWPNNGIVLYGTTLVTQPINLFHPSRKLIAEYYNKQKTINNDIKSSNRVDAGAGRNYMNQHPVHSGKQDEHNTELMNSVSSVSAKGMLQNTKDDVDARDQTDQKAASDVGDTLKEHIFLSYCHKDEVRADDIYNRLNNNPQIIVHIDKVDIGKWESIREYMDSISEMDYIILLISESYLKSENCMYEVLEVMRDKKYKDRIFPAIIYTEIYEESNRIKFVRYWQEKYRKLEEDLRDIDGQNLGPLPKTIKQYRDIASNMLDFLTEVSDLNNPELEDVVVAIEDKLKKIRDHKRER